MKIMIRIIPILAVLLPFSSIHAQIVPAIEWQKSLGGTGDERAYSIQQTTDGGFIMAGAVNSNDGDVSGWHAGYEYYTGNPYSDFWIVKLDTVGNLVWQKCLGGSDDDQAQSIQQTSDGGFIVAGWTSSNDGDVVGWHWGLNYYDDRTSDYWVVKLDSAGNLIWQKTLGGSGYDRGQSIQQTSDGGFIVAGSSASYNGDVTGKHGYYYDITNDYWIVKLDNDGNLVWQKCLGGSSFDYAKSIQQTTDGGFVVAGYSFSNDGDVSGNHGGYVYGDCWIAKLDSVGNLGWQKCLGGSADDAGYSIQQTTDGGFIVAGETLSNDGDVSGNHGSDDGWIIKLDTAGNLVWQKCLGGSSGDQAYSVQQTTDEGYIVAGTTGSNDDDVSGFHGGTSDYWIVKIDTDGNLIWQKTLGGSNQEIARSIQQTADGGLIVAGFSSSNDDDVSGNHLTYDGFTTPDYWIVKLTGGIPTGIAPFSNSFISLYPNPVQTRLTLTLHSFSEGGINLTAPSNELTIRVYDLNGKIIGVPATLKNTQIQLNTTTLPNGFYTLLIMNNRTGESEAGKFVKQ